LKKKLLFSFLAQKPQKKDENYLAFFEANGSPLPDL